MSSSSGEGTQQSTTKATSTVKIVVVTTVRETTKAARATAAGATRTTAVIVATMTPNGDEDNEDGNSKNNNKATMKPPMRTEEGEHCQSLRDNRSGGHHRPRDAAIAPTAASSQHTFVGSCCFRVERSELSTTHGMGIHNRKLVSVICQPISVRRPSKKMRFLGFELGTKISLAIIASLHHPPLILYTILPAGAMCELPRLFGGNSHSNATCNFCPDQLGCVRLPRPVRVHWLPHKLGLRAAAPIVRVECGRGVG